MNKFLGWVLLLTVCFSLTSSAQTEEVYSRYRYQFDHQVKMDKLVIKFAPNTPLADIQSILKEQGLTFLYQVPWPSITYAQLATPAKNYSELKAILANLANNKQVEFANPILETADKSGYAVLNEMFVKLNATTPLSTLKEMGVQYGFEVKEKYQYLDNVYILNVNKQNTANALELSLLLKNKGLFTYAEPDYLFNPLVCTNDSLYKRQWAIKNDSTTVFKAGLHGTINADMQVDSAWTITTGSPNITIAVIDAGVDTLHPDLVGNLLPGYDATGQGSHGYPNTNKRENGHGTSCTGIIVAQGDNNIGIAGVAYSCKVMPIRVFYYIDTSLFGQPLPNTPWSTARWMADAIGYAWHTGNVDIMSNSWAVPDALFAQIGDSNDINTVTDVINQASVQGRSGKGIPMFFSSGNFDPAQPLIAPVPLWPSRLHSAIAVNATSMCDEAKSLTSCDHEQWIGHHGDSLKISAPGVQVTTTDMTGNLGYNNTNYVTDFNGTSAACPNAAGVMALLLSSRPDLSWGDAIQLMYHNADTIGGYNYDTIKEYGQWSNEVGYGRVNAFRTLTAAQSFVGIQENHQAAIGGLTVYPNPTQNSVNLSFTLTKSADINIQVYATDGKIMLQQHIGVPPVGKQTQALLINSFPAGFYFGKVIQDNGESLPFRFVIMK